MCAEPGGQTVAYLRLIWDEPSVQDHCMGRGWSVFDSYGVTHVYRPGGQTVASLRLMWDEPSVRDHCMGRGWSVFDSYEVPMSTEPGDIRWLTSDSCEASRLSEPTAWAEGGWPLTHMRCP